MSATLPRKPLLCRWPLAACVLALPALLSAQEASAPPDPLAGVAVQVLDQEQVDVGTHLITFQRIAPPVFPAAPPTPAGSGPAVKAVRRVADARARHATSPRTPVRATRDAADGGGPKPFDVLFLSATVYDHQFTELRWPEGGPGGGLVVAVNFDFNDLTGVGTLETSAATYALILAVGDDTRDSLLQAGGQPPDLAAFPAGRSSYQVISGQAANHADDLLALDALCAFYDAHQSDLVAAYAQGQAEAAARQQWLQAHPPVTPDTVVNFWPIQSGVYLPAGH